MAANAASAMLDAMARRPLAMMCLAVNLRLVVPLLAKALGNEDPMKNSISHVFGQQTLCAAMDFPGWVEAATAMFAIAGLMDTFALHRIYRHKCELIQAGGGVATYAPGSPSSASVAPAHSAPHAIFLATLALFANAFSLVAVRNPALNSDSDTVFWHTMPYVLLIFEYQLLQIYLMVCLPPKDVSHRLTVAWHSIAITCAVSTTIMWLAIVDTFVEMYKNGIQDIIRDEYAFPFERQALLIANEYLMVTSYLLSAIVHPLGWRGLDARSSPKSIECAGPSRDDRPGAADGTSSATSA